MSRLKARPLNFSMREAAPILERRDGSIVIGCTVTGMRGEAGACMRQAFYSLVDDDKQLSGFSCDLHVNDAVETADVWDDLVTGRSVRKADAELADMGLLDD